MSKLGRRSLSLEGPWDPALPWLLFPCHREVVALFHYLFFSWFLGYHCPKTVWRDQGSKLLKSIGQVTSPLHRLFPPKHLSQWWEADRQSISFCGLGTILPPGVGSVAHALNSPAYIHSSWFNHLGCYVIFSEDFQAPNE